MKCLTSIRKGLQPSLVDLWASLVELWHNISRRWCWKVPARACPTWQGCRVSTTCLRDQCSTILWTLAALAKNDKWIVKMESPYYPHTHTPEYIHIYVAYIILDMHISVCLSLYISMFYTISLNRHHHSPHSTQSRYVPIPQHVAGAMDVPMSQRGAAPVWQAKVVNSLISSLDGWWIQRFTDEQRLVNLKDLWVIRFMMTLDGKPLPMVYWIYWSLRMVLLKDGDRVLLQEMSSSTSGARGSVAMMVLQAPRGAPVVSSGAALGLRCRRFVAFGSLWILMEYVFQWIFYGYSKLWLFMDILLSYDYSWIFYDFVSVIAGYFHGYYVSARMGERCVGTRGLSHSTDEKLHCSRRHFPHLPQDIFLMPHNQWSTMVIDMWPWLLTFSCYAEGQYPLVKDATSEVHIRRLDFSRLAWNKVAMTVIRYCIPLILDG